MCKSFLKKQELKRFTVNRRLKEDSFLKLRFSSDEQCELALAKIYQEKYALPVVRDGDTTDCNAMFAILSNEEYYSVLKFFWYLILDCDQLLLKHSLAQPYFAVEDVHR